MCVNIYIYISQHDKSFLCSLLSKRYSLLCGERELRTHVRTPKTILGVRACVDGREKGKITKKNALSHLGGSPRQAHADCFSRLGRVGGQTRRVLRPQRGAEISDLRRRGVFVESLF